MQDIEKLKAKHETELAEALEAHRIFTELPTPPARVLFSLDIQPWIIYNAKNVAEAVEIFRLYTPEPWVTASDGGCTVLSPWETIEAKYNSRGREYRDTGRGSKDGAPYFYCSAGERFSSCAMEFFTRVLGKVMKVEIKIDSKEVRVECVKRRHQRDYYEKRYPNPVGARTITWGFGEDAACGTYWFSDLAAFWLAIESIVPAPQAA